jgi:hypothetical protein
MMKKNYVFIALAGWLMFAAPVFAQQDPVLDKPFLFETVRHLYRWYLDETDAEKVVGSENFPFWIRELKPELDAGDKSRMAEVWLPELGIAVTARQADYTIEELDVVVKNDSFKIIRVRKGKPHEKSDGFQVVEVPYKEIRDYGFKTRNLSRFPEGDFLVHLRTAARNEITTYLKNRKEEIPEGDQLVYFSPISKVSNEIWVFWETGRMLIRYASDIDLENPAVWEHEDLAVKLYNIDEQTVVTLDEVAGSNAYMTRDQVGRYLFNCVVLGKRMVLSPPTKEESDKLKAVAPDKK